MKERVNTKTQILERISERHNVMAIRRKIAKQTREAIASEISIGRNYIDADFNAINSVRNVIKRHDMLENAVIVLSDFLNDFDQNSPL